VLALAGAALAGSVAATGAGTAAAEGSIGSGLEETEADGGPLGGGEGYGRTVARAAADHVVETREALGDALSKAAAGDVVFVPDGTAIALGESTFTVPSGVTLASNRGVDGAAGGLLYADEETEAMYVHADARVTGLRIRGPYEDYFDPGWYAVGTGLQVVGDDAEVDNCEVWGFAYAAVDCRADAYVHHSHVHHNARDGLGYGVLANDGHPLVEWNYFDYNRHSMVSSGTHHGYTCRYNHFAADAVGAPIDVHSPGGVRSTIHNNVVEPVRHAVHGGRFRAVQVRGVPDERVAVRDNWFFNEQEPRDDPAGWTDEAVVQPTEAAWRSVDVEDNHYGESAAVQFSDIIPGGN